MKVKELMEKLAGLNPNAEIDISFCYSRNYNDVEADILAGETELASFLVGDKAAPFFDKEM